MGNENRDRSDRRQGDRRSWQTASILEERRFGMRRDGFDRRDKGAGETGGFAGNKLVMNHKLNPETRDRLQHALARLQAEPRSGERRSLERRIAEVPEWLLIDDRRTLAERRTNNRRDR